MRHFYTEALTINKCPNTTVCYICKYVDDKIQQSNDSLELTPDKENAFYTSILRYKPLIGTETIE